MKYSKHSFLFLILIYFILILSFITKAQDNAINFNNFRASEGKLTKSEIIILPLTDPQTKTLTLQLENNSDNQQVNESENHNLIASQLEIETSQDIYTFEKQKSKLSIPVHKNDFLTEDQQTILLILSYTVYPEDKPGTYEGQLVFTQNNEKHKLLLQATVEPWLKLETKTKTHHINQRIVDKKKLISEVPGILQISGNISWQLFATKEVNDFHYAEQLQLNLIHENDNFLLLKDEIYFDDRKILLAEGNSPSEDSEDLIEIPFVVTINNYPKIKAGQINFPLSFQIDPQKNLQ
ncbi:MAG: hypothetical protein ACOCRX_12475 [Candidatus Woesearchaeota archaeon]